VGSELGSRVAVVDPLCVCVPEGRNMYASRLRRVCGGSLRTRACHIDKSNSAGCSDVVCASD